MMIVMANAYNDHIYQDRYNGDISCRLRYWLLHKLSYKRTVTCYVDAFADLLLTVKHEG